MCQNPKSPVMVFRTCVQLMRVRECRACIGKRFLLLSGSRTWVDWQTFGYKRRKPPCRGQIMHKAPTTCRKEGNASCGLKKKREKVFSCQLMAARHFINICARAWRCEPLRCKSFWSCSTTYPVKKQSMGAIHKMAATLGIPLPRGPCGATSASQALLSCLSLSLEWKKPLTKENLSGSTCPFRHNADFCFHRAKISDLRELIRLASVGNLWRSSRVWRRYFGRTELISMHGVRLQSQASQCVFNPQEDFLLVKFGSRTMESWTSAAALTVVHYTCTVAN